MQNDLADYHAAAPDAPIVPHQALARTMAVLVETRAAALIIFDAAIDLLDDDRPDAALRMLREAVDVLRPQRILQ